MLYGVDMLKIRDEHEKIRKRSIFISRLVWEIIPQGQVNDN